MPVVSGSLPLQEASVGPMQGLARLSLDTRPALRYKSFGNKPFTTSMGSGTMMLDDTLYDTVHKVRQAHARTAVALGLTALVLAGCSILPGTDNDDGMAMEPVTEVPPMDVVLISDFLRFYLDGDMEMDRGITDCYGGLCVSTDGERILFSFPEDYVFAGFHDEYITAHEDTIEERNGIKLGDVSLENKELPDIPGVAVDRTITGWGGWGEYVGFDTLYYDYVRNDRPQRIVWATLGGYRSEGNPAGDALTWKGGASAIDYSDIMETRNLLGNAEVGLQFVEVLDEFLVHVAITDLTDVVTEAAYDDLSWRNMPLRDGGFETFEIRGQFFGPNHEEVGGVFERDMITGGFAARRMEDEAD